MSIQQRLQYALKGANYEQNLCEHTRNILFINFAHKNSHLI